MPCPYLPGRIEQQLFAELAGNGVQDVFEQLSLGGFRRSHHIAYRPACRGCSATSSSLLQELFKPLFPSVTDARHAKKREFYFFMIAMVANLFFTQSTTDADECPVTLRSF